MLAVVESSVVGSLDEIAAEVASGTGQADIMTAFAASDDVTAANGGVVLDVTAVEVIATDADGTAVTAVTTAAPDAHADDDDHDDHVEFHNSGNRASMGLFGIACVLFNAL